MLRSNEMNFKFIMLCQSSMSIIQVQLMKLFIDKICGVINDRVLNNSR